MNDAHAIKDRVICFRPSLETICLLNEEQTQRTKSTGVFVSRTGLIEESVQSHLKRRNTRKTGRKQ